MKSDDYKRALNSAFNRVNNQWPRVQIMVILGLTGVAAFLTSALLLRLGVTEMVVRYPVAIAAAYGVFIMLIGLWLWMQREEPDMDETVHEVIDNLDFIDDGRIISTGGINTGTSTPPNLSGSSGGSSIDLPGIDVDLDLDDAIWIVLAIVVLIAGLLAIFYVVYIAPVLLTEVLVDGLLAAGLYKTVKDAHGRHWMMTVIKKTAIPAVLALVFFSIAGFCVQKIVPGTTSIGEAWRLFSAG